MTLDLQGLEAAILALAEQIRTEARDQGGYLHSFPDGRVSLELEWVDPAEWLRSAILAYIAEVKRNQA